jgi:colanic acid/amylovoran biosynthesis glycosyltransferase
LLTTFYGADATEYPRYPRWRERYRRLFAAGALFLAEGGAMAQKLVDIGCPQDKVRVWRLGVDVAGIEYAPRVVGERVRLLICAGFKEKKGIPYALQALALALAQKPFPYALTLIGDGEDRPQIEALVDELGLRPCTSFRGMRPYAEVLAELLNHDILLQTSATAKNGDGEGGAPVILLDAQASGMPVVATTHDDIPEYVRAGESGLLAAERDVEGLAEHISALVAEPERWAAMGRAGRQHVEQCYDAVRQVAELEAIYGQLI